ncbi:MAG TPA: HepT-like ribonuclease domain-containing protein [Candidatus Sulfotelmatobacter sp.]|jgi:uncharacterized protein with HEPN domain|nr:HepT-like ribonuclease domain-containing protein [Candidatus Sulfotelmatobacter sp.]
MSRHDPRVTLRQLAENARHAQDLCKANSLPEILTDWQKRAAFERVMEVLGEAVKRLPPELTAQYPAVDWRGIAGMRDRVSHGYDAIDHGLLWQAVELRVPGLLTTVEQMLKDSDASA